MPPVPGARGPRRGPHRRAVVPDRPAAADPTPAWGTTAARSAGDDQRYALGGADWLLMADPAGTLRSLAGCLCVLPSLAPDRTLAAHPAGPRGRSARNCRWLTL